MKHFMKIKRTIVHNQPKYEPLYDEFTEELIGFIG